MHAHTLMHAPTLLFSIYLAGALTMLQGQKAVAVSQVWLTMPRKTFVPVM